MLDLCFLAVRHSAWLALEHPEDHGDPHPSIFVVPVVVELRLLCGVSQDICFDQCRFGAATVKGTQILTNDACMVSSMSGLRCCHGYRHRRAIGVRNNRFLTASSALSQYPASLCAKFAQCLLDACCVEGGRWCLARKA